MTRDVNMPNFNKLTLDFSDNTGSLRIEDSLITSSKGEAFYRFCADFDYEAILIVYNDNGPELPNMELPEFFGWVYQHTQVMGNMTQWFFKTTNCNQDHLRQVFFIYEIFYG